MNRAGLWITDPHQAYQTVADALRSAIPALLFGLRLWAAVSLSLYIAFWLELDSPSWAGTTAAIVCQPSLGASLRKGWFRMVGCACRKSNSHIQMMKSAEKWRGHNAINGMYRSWRRRVLVD
jgi:hypothetical protein